MAAAEVLAFTESFFENEPGRLADRTSQIGWDDRFLCAQLSLIAQAWFIERNNVVRVGFFISF